MKLTKKDLTEKLVEICGLKKKEAELMLNTTFSLIRDELEAGNDVELSGIGTIKQKINPQREARNPKSGEKIIVAENKTLKFSINAGLKKELNKLI